jgi:hypothetical protein
MVIGGQLEVNLRLSLLITDSSVYMDGHPQGTVVIFPCSLVMQSLKEAMM